MFKFFKRKKTQVELYAPMTGKAIELEEVPDPAFAEKMLGDGVAVEPSEGLVVAPCAGKIVQIFPTNHALGIETKEGLDILLHLGIDTVELKGEGFERVVEEGQEVKVGTPLIKMDLDKIKELGKPVTTPLIITTMDLIKELTLNTGDVVAGKDVVLTIELNK